MKRLNIKLQLWRENLVRNGPTEVYDRALTSREQKLRNWPEKRILENGIALQAKMMR
jgi:hypothetical protein